MRRSFSPIAATSSAPAQLKSATHMILQTGKRSTWLRDSRLIKQDESGESCAGAA